MAIGLTHQLPPSPIQMATDRTMPPPTVRSHRYRDPVTPPAYHRPGSPLHPCLHEATSRAPQSLLPTATHLYKRGHSVSAAAFRPWSLLTPRLAQILTPLTLPLPLIHYWLSENHGNHRIQSCHRHHFHSLGELYHPALPVFDSIAHLTLPGALGLLPGRHRESTAAPLPLSPPHRPITSVRT
jgi:hypothetical protein